MAAPSIPVTRLASVSSAALAVRTSRPLRSTVTVSEVEHLVEEVAHVDDGGSRLTSVRIISCSVAVSTCVRDEVGSSMTITLAFVATARSISTIC